MSYTPLFAAFASALSLQALAATLPPETPLVVDGPIKVDAADLEGYMLRVPGEKRADVRSSHDRVASMVDNIFVTRAVAAKARGLGLDKDVAVQRRLQQVQDALLADVYMQHLEKTSPTPNLDQRALELYRADQARYVTAEQVHIQHLLVGLTGRTREMALQRAKEVRAEAVSGKEDFLALAARLSDDPDKKRNGGDLGYNSPNSFVEPMVKALATMKKGEISEPIESRLGFHIVRLIDRKLAEPIPFERAKESIVNAEKERIAKKRHEDLVREIRDSKTVVVHRNNVEALVGTSTDASATASAAEAKKAN